jgi:plastocyanin
MPIRNALSPTAALAVIQLAMPAFAQTTQTGPSVYEIDSGVAFTLDNVGASNFLFNWSDSSGTFSDVVDPTVVLTAGQTYTFQRISGSHPFVITDDTLEVNGSDGSYSRVTFSGAVIDAATLQPIADFTADPGPTDDLISWTPGVEDAGEYFYTCRVTGHAGMTGRIVVVAPADPRDVQIRSVDFEAQTIELYNYGPVDQDLSGWRFCSHDFNDVRRYSGANGLNGVSIESGSSVFVHFSDDAPGGDADRMNRTDLGGSFALPLDQDAYGIQIFNPGSNGSVSFGNSDLIADHVQWNIDGEGVGSAEFRTGQAVSVGLWTAIGDFVSTVSNSDSILLSDLGDGRLHGPDNYTVTNPCPVDFTGDGDLNFFDVSAFLSGFNASDPLADLNDDGQFNFFDVSIFLSLFNAGCP